MPRRIQTIVIVLLLCLDWAGAAMAQPFGEQEFGFESTISLDDAVARVRARTNARILAAETHRTGGSPVHVIRILTRKGKVRHIRIDAETGRLLSRH